VANKSRESISFDRESFTLETEDGVRYPLVSHREYLDQYTGPRSRADIRLADTMLDAMELRFVNYAYEPWRLYPYKGEASTMQESVTLGSRFWTVGYLYFPVPDGGVKGKRFRLLVSSRDLPEILVVDFRVA
jgi:hypothetical protein